MAAFCTITETQLYKGYVCSGNIRARLDHCKLYAETLIGGTMRTVTLGPKQSRERLTWQTMSLLEKRTIILYLGVLYLFLS